MQDQKQCPKRQYVRRQEKYARFDHFLLNEWLYLCNSLNILSYIFWHNFRVPTTHMGQFGDNKKIAIFGHYGAKNGLKKPKIAKTNQRSYLYLFLPL